MNSLKRFFIMPYILGLSAGAFHSLAMLFSSGLMTAWLGSFIACAPGFLFFARIMGQTVVRTSDHTPQLWGAGILGTVLALSLPAASSTPLIYAGLVAVFGGLAYDFWYSRLGSRSSSSLKVGKPLPSFRLQDTEGNTIDSSQIKKSPALLMFYRGNWCPLCMAQIKEVAAQYKELNQRGVKTYLISNQSHENSKALAQKLGVDFEFMVDVDAQVSRTLGILHEGGTPAGMLGYEADTTMPTVVVTDAQGTVIFADLTDNYRVRPEPTTFLSVLDAHGVEAT